MAVLGFYGPQSIPSITKRINKEDYLTSKFQEFTSKPNIHLEDMNVRRAIEMLEKQGIVRKLQYASIKTKAEIVGLTFHGLIWYFRTSGKRKHTKDRINFFFNRFNEPYEKIYAHKSERRKNRLVVLGFKELVPFCTLWSEMTKRIGGKCLDRLELTVNSFGVDGKSPSRIEPLGLELETYINCSRRESSEGFYFEKDPLVMNYLKHDEAALLREAYLAYLINEDFKELSKLSEMDIKVKLPKLKSVTEIASFEKNVGPTTLFSEKGLARFFPQYSGIEYFFTGMFINNLLWDTEPIDSYNYQI